MWQRLKDSIAKMKTATGLEIFLLPDGDMQLHAVTASIKNGNIVKETEVYYLKSFEELSKKIAVDVPLSIVLNGKGVLTKKMTALPETDNPVQQVLPQANPTDFYCETYKTITGVVLFLMRKEAAEKIIHDLQQYGYRVMGISTGFTSIDTVLPFLQTEDSSEVIAGHFRLQVNNRRVDDAEILNAAANERFKQPEYLVANQYVPAAGMLGFAAATALLAGNSPAIHNEQVDAQREEFAYANYFRAAAWSLLIALFAILLINFFIYNNYFSKNMELQASQLINKDNLAKKSVLEKTLQQKELFLQQAGWLHRSRTSFFADRVASMLPADILLTSLSFYPINASVTTYDAPVRFRTDTIQLTGNCADPVQLNQFVNNLKNINSIKTVAVKNYQYKKELEAGSFFIEIVTR